jgi:hypothetical protein
MKMPVLMSTGQAISQLPSPAQVWIASCRSPPELLPARGRFGLARHLAPQCIRCRGVVVVATRADGSQGPHWMQRSLISFDDRRRLKVLEVTFGIVSEDDPGGQNVLRIASPRSRISR